MLEQADRRLAEKMDQFAQLNEAEVRAAREPEAAGETATPSLVAAAVQRLDESTQGLQRALAGLHRRVVRQEGWTHDELEQLVHECVAELRGIQSVGAELVAGRVSGPRREAASLVDIASRAARAVRPSLPEGAALELEPPPTLPSICCDPVQIEQLVVQLLLNAGRACTARVSVSFRRAEMGVELSVEDDGSGIEADLLDRVFDPFDAPPTAAVSTGFGLPVSYRIAKAHGGELRVKSSPGHGTRVTVVLPSAADGTIEADAGEG